jgi:DNA-binding MarR family transcriptional regulator
MNHAHGEHFARLMAAHGITDTHGVEVMRRVRMVASAYDVIMQAQTRAENLSAPRWRLLLHLYMAELAGEAAVSPTQLSKFQNVSKNTVSSLLRSLEDQGLIERDLDRDDRRQFHIRLSAAGRDLIRSSTPSHMAHLNALVTDLSPSDIATLSELLQRLHISLMRHGDLPATYCPEDRGQRTED